MLATAEVLGAGSVLTTDAGSRAIIFDAAAQVSLDITSADVLRGLFATLQAAAIRVYVADVHGPLLERARELGLGEVVDEDHVLPTVDAAVRNAEAGT